MSILPRPASEQVRAFQALGVAASSFTLLLAASSLEIGTQSYLIADCSSPKSTPDPREEPTPPRQSCSSTTTVVRQTILPACSGGSSPASKARKARSGSRIV
jgi:hypothetical protein